MAKHTSRLTIDLSKGDHKKNKNSRSSNGYYHERSGHLSVAAFINRKPNKVTEKALQQVKTGKGVKKFESLKDLLEDLK